MVSTEKDKQLINWAAAGPVITLLIAGGGMIAGFSAVLENQKAQAKEIQEVSQRVDKLYDLLVYPSVGRP
jgi:hypothetical protein